MKKLQSFLGFANFYRKFIKEYSRTTALFTELIRKNTIFIQNELIQEAFEELKYKFTQAPILAIFDSEKQIVIKTDILDYVIEIYISQLDNEEQYRFVIFYSRKIILIELNYEIHDKKLLV